MTHIESASPNTVYELRQYFVLPGKLDDLLARFRDHTIRIFARHGLHGVAYWTVPDAAPDAPALVYVLAHESRDAVQPSWEAFRADPEWQSVRAASEQNGKIVSRIQSTLMHLANFSPPLPAVE